MQRRKMIRCAALTAALTVVASISSTWADNWPQWRGSNDRGAAPEGEFPEKFSHETGVAWKVELPGVGCSTPIVWGESIFVTCGIDGNDGVVCYGLDGRERWRREFGPERPGKHPNGSGSNPSPATDGEHLIVYYKSGTLACLDLDGKTNWQVNLQEKYGPDTLWWDLGTSPVLAGDRVIVAVMQEGGSYLAAFDAASGDEIWKVERNYKCAQETDHAYTTPHVVDVDGQQQLVVWGADHLTGHDLKTGEMLWQCGGFNPDAEKNWRVIASLAIDGQLALVPYGRGDYLAGVRLGGSGDVTKSARVWENFGRRIGSDVPTPALCDGRAYLLGDFGRVSCVDVESGEELWADELPKHRKKYFSSPVLAGDKLYCPREDGVIFVGRVSDEGFELLAENDMGEPTIAAPVPIDGGLLIRGREHLFRVEN